jgi:hypothetical protein
MTEPLDEAGRAALIGALAACRDALGPLGATGVPAERP